MTNIYHINDHFVPYEKYGMTVEYEELALALVESGKLRVDTGTQRNFTIFSDPYSRTSQMISARELLHPSLVKETKAFFSNIFSNRFQGANLEKKVNAVIKNLVLKVNRHLKVNSSLMLKLSRLFVQSAHPIVIKWLLLEKVEVFIAYSHNIGDVMDIKTWQRSGSNSGMQSTDGQNVAIFVSCGGDPFAATNKDHPIYGNGWPAMARLRIIAAQELAHYSDIMRDDYGRQISRHSADFGANRAKPHVRQARKNDLNRCDKFLDLMLPRGLSKLIFHEDAIKFYEKNNINNLHKLKAKVMVYFYRQRVLSAADQLGFTFVRKFKRELYLGRMLRAIAKDMRFNLAPVADVYVGKDDEQTEAIACVEALARVPQQAVKWGHLTTQYFMQDLYKIYYEEVIPSLIRVYENVTHSKFERNITKIKAPLWRKIKMFFSNLFSKKDENIPPSREV